MNVLVLAPHADDFELGCGGTISKLARQGYLVHVAVFCLGLSTEDELKKSIGLYDATYTLFDFTNKFLYSDRQSILDWMMGVNSLYDMVFTPCKNDLHQDHQVICTESLRAFKHTSLFGYILPWNCTAINPVLHTSISFEDLNRKIESIACYRSQSNKAYTNIDYTRGRAISDGVIVGCKYAELLEVYRWYLV